jgi:putative ABC transport system permease protein
LSSIAQDLRLAVRAWRRRPALNAVIIATLALGICATTAVFSVVNAVLLQPLPYPVPERLAVVRGELPVQGLRSALLSGAEVVALAERPGALTGVGGVWARPGVLRGGDGSPEEIEVGWMTPGFLETLATPPLLGRWPTPAEHAAYSPDVIVLGHAFWQRRYGSDPSIVGRSIEFDDELRTVIGVMPRSFRMLFPDEEGVPEDPDAWLPWGSSLRELPRGFRVFTVVDRLADGTSWTEAGADLQAAAVTIAGTHVEYVRSGYGLHLEPLAAALVSDIRPTLLVLLGVVAFVLLIACANVANLLMARVADQARDLSVRAALGAGRGRLWRQLLTESASLGVVAGILGVALAEGAVRVLRALDPDGLPRLSDVAVDASTLVFAAMVTFAAAVLFGAAAATHALAGATTGSLQAPARGEAARSEAARRLLVVSQVSLSLVLLAGAGLLLRSFVRLNAVDLGFEPANVVSLRLSLPDVRYPYPTHGLQIGEFYRRLDELVAQMPGVLEVGATLNPPLSELPMRPRPYAYRSEDSEVEWGVLAADYRTVTPGWFRAAGVRLTAGRLLDDRDRWDRPLAVVVDTTLARKAWPNQDPVGLFGWSCFARACSARTGPRSSGSSSRSACRASSRSSVSRSTSPTTRRRSERCIPRSRRQDIQWRCCPPCRPLCIHWRRTCRSSTSGWPPTTCRWRWRVPASR